jgi:hypothetical protein
VDSSVEVIEPELGWNAAKCHRGEKNGRDKLVALQQLEAHSGWHWQSVQAEFEVSLGHCNVPVAGSHVKLKSTRPDSCSARSPTSLAFTQQALYSSYYSLCTRGMEKHSAISNGTAFA